MLRSQSKCTQNVIGGYIGRKMIQSPQFTQDVPTGFQVTSPPVRGWIERESRARGNKGRSTRSLAELCQQFTRDLRYERSRVTQQSNNLAEVWMTLRLLQARVPAPAEPIDLTVQIRDTGGEVTWKPVGTSWVNCGLWIIFPPMYPPITFWVHPDCDLNMCPACNHQ